MAQEDPVAGVKATGRGEVTGLTPEDVVLTIVYRPSTNGVRVVGPVLNWPLCFKMMDSAREGITEMHSKNIYQQQAAIVPATQEDVAKVEQGKQTMDGIIKQIRQ